MRSVEIGRIVRSKSGNLVFCVESNDEVLLQGVKEFLRKKLIVEGVTVSADFTGPYDSKEVCLGVSD